MSSIAETVFVRVALHFDAEYARQGKAKHKERVKTPSDTRTKMSNKLSIIQLLYFMCISYMAFLTRYSRPIEQIFFRNKMTNCLKIKWYLYWIRAFFVPCLIQMDNNSKYYYETVKYCKCTFFWSYSKIDAFDYDELSGTIFNRRNVIVVDHSLGVSY